MKNENITLRINGETVKNESCDLSFETGNDKKYYLGILMSETVKNEIEKLNLEYNEKGDSETLTTEESLFKFGYKRKIKEILINNFDDIDFIRSTYAKKNLKMEE